MSGKIKPSYDSNRCQLGKCTPLDTPFRLTLDTSEVCNFKCNYCFRCEAPSPSWGYAAQNNLMELETFEIAVQQILQFPSKPKVVALSGSGEPLCNKNIPYMASRVRELCCAEKIEMHTNASLLTKENVKEIATCGIDKIVVSLQGVNARTYQSVCDVKINFEEFYDNLKLLYQYKSTNTLLHIKVVDQAIQGPEDEKLFYTLFEPIADQVFIEKVVALWQEQLKYDERANSLSNKYGVDLGEVECCPILFTNLTISPDGTIWPCCVIHPPFSLGNIKEISMVEAWNSEKRRNFLKKNLIEGHACHKQCENCYFPKGYVKSKLDILDPYREEILTRL